MEEEYRIDIEPAQIPHLLMAEKIAPGKAHLLVLATRSPVQLMETGLSGKTGDNAVCRVVEEHRVVVGPVLILRRNLVVETALARVKIRGLVTTNRVQLMEGGQDGVIGRLALNRAVMVLSCPVDHVPILPLPLEELTVREITYSQGRAKKWNVLLMEIGPIGDTGRSAV